MNWLVWVRIPPSSLVALVWILCLRGLVEASLQIVPGGSWTASNGKHVQAHGAGLVLENGRFYLIGEDKTEGTAFHNINCYSSTNLVEWRFERALLTRQSSGDLGPSRVVERPKVLWNAASSNYVMWLHIDSSNYGEAKTGVAVKAGGGGVCGGTYEYRGSFRPLGHVSRDMGLFADPGTGTGYLLAEDREHGLRIMELSAAYTNATRDVYVWAEKIESPALVKVGATYFMFGSHLTGWDANDNVYSTATSLGGPWSAWRTFATAGSNTYTSQTSYVLPVSGSLAIYLGDRWQPDNLASSTYVWLPITFSGTTATMRDQVSWVPSLSVTAVTFAGVRSDAATVTTVRLKHRNGDAAPRYAAVSVGGQTQTVECVQTPGTAPGSCVAHLRLAQGAANDIRVAGRGDGSWAPDIDRIMVPAT
jgi:hypothetical protein